MALERQPPDDPQDHLPVNRPDPGVRPSFDANVLETERTKRSPFAAFTFVDVTFGTANTDYIISHTLATPDPEVIRWWVIQNDTAGVVYRDPSASGVAPREWGEGYVVLKCSVANANVRLLLFVEQI